MDPMFFAIVGTAVALGALALWLFLGDTTKPARPAPTYPADRVMDSATLAPALEDDLLGFGDSAPCQAKSAGASTTG